MNIAPYRIMVIGQMASGKTTVADYLVETYGYKKLTLAKAIKDIVNEIDEKDPVTLIYDHVAKYAPIDGKEFHAMRQAIIKTKEIPHEEPKPRKRLQYLGTEGGRQTVRDSIWIDIVKGQIHPKEKYVIDDVRFVNEYLSFYAINFIPIKLRVAKETQHKRLLDLYGEYDTNILKHPSETEYYKIRIDSKFSINNDGPIDHLYHYVDLLLEL